MHKSEQSKALDFDSVLKLLEETNENYFVTGRAGTGKTTLLNKFRLQTKKNYVVIAPTGVAAVNCGGVTIHSFFKFPPKFITREMIQADKRRAKLFQNMDCLIIDEVSMVRADLMDAIDQALRINRQLPDIPFGGVQLLCFGDLYQLPPVVESGELAEYFQQIYSTPFFFSALVFLKCPIKTIELTKIYRQKDKRFKELLEAVRNNKLSTDIIAELNSRYDADFTLEKIGLGAASYENSGLDYEPTIILTTNNYKVATINNAQLKSLTGKSYKFNAKVTGNFDEKAFPAENELELKLGAQVMLLQNDPEKRWQNGTLAKITALNKGEITISIDEVEYELEPVAWNKSEYIYDLASQKIEQKEVGTFTQYPLKLAWAITIHKSQGKTFDNVVIDLDRGAFAHGQTYVALSRCTKLEGIILTRPIRASDVKIDNEIIDFINSSVEEVL